MIGESAGRSPSHRQRGTARRRFTPEERTANTPLPDDPQEWPDDEPRHSQLRESIRDLVIAVVVIVVVYIGMEMSHSMNQIISGIGVTTIAVTATTGWFAAINARRR